MAGAEARYRQAEPADAPAEHAIFNRAVGDIHRARAYPWSDVAFADFSLARAHVLESDPGRCWVAEVDGRVVGYTRAIVRDGTWFFASLFVDPSMQGRGIGRRLFKLALRGAPDRRLTITDSIQPISNGLYGSAGLLPIAPLIRLVGVAERRSGTSLEPIEAAIDELAAVDRAAYGFERRIDHPYWASRGARHAWSRDGSVVAWSYRWSNGNIGPLAAVDAATAADAFQGELAIDSAVSIELPASARPLLTAALQVGLRIEPPMGLLLASDGIPPPDSLAISTYGLF